VSEEPISRCKIDEFLNGGISTAEIRDLLLERRKIRRHNNCYGGGKHRYAK